MMQTKDLTDLLKRKLAKLSTKDVLDIQAFVADLVSQQATDVALERRSADTKTYCEHIKAKVKNRNTVRGNAVGLSIGRIDAYHRDVENLVNRRCMGVSTRYLMNYFGWARRMTQHRPFGTDLLAEMLSAG